MPRPRRVRKTARQQGLIVEDTDDRTVEMVQDPHGYFERALAEALHEVEEEEEELLARADRHDDPLPA